MSLTSSLFAGVSGLNAQSTVLSIVGDNIANISTVGFKSGSVTFASLVTGQSSLVGGSGSIARNRAGIDQQGLIQTTGVATDVAVSGQGFFVVKDDPTFGQGDYKYTRAGSFRQDERGFFVNAAGFYLQAWPLDSEGRLPGAAGNANSTSNQLLESLTSVNTRDISGIAFATTSISLGLNLNASEEILQGSGDTLQPVSSLNEGIAANDILVPTANEIEEGDILNITLGDGTNFAFLYDGVAQTDNITTSNKFGAATPSQRFTVGAGLADGDTFTITNVTSGIVTFTFTDVADPDTDNGEFNSLETLADAIDSVVGIHARIADNRLVIAAEDARENLEFDNVTGTILTTLQSVGSGLADITSTSANRFNTLAGLAALVNEQSEISATVTNPASNARVTINVNNPLDTITFADAGGNGGVLLTEFGLTAGAQGPIYDATGVSGSNMASGDISPAFSRNIRIFDSLGGGHDVRVSFVKAANNEWLVEVFAANEDEINTDNPNGLIASGTLSFNGDGSLNDVSAGLSDAIEVVWTNDSETSTITFDWGTSGPTGTGLTDGLSQFNGPYNVQFAEQNGASAGLLSSLEINEEGFIIANFSNGQSRSVFQIPLANFPNVNGLTPEGGNVFGSSDQSGEFSLNLAGSSGVGTLSVAALEGSNVDLAGELTDIIVAQRAFQANTRVITTVDDLLDELNRI